MTAAFAERPMLTRLARPSLETLWIFLGLALPVVAALVASLPTVDLAYQLRAGSDILAGRGVPTADAWTFTGYGAPWLDQQWAAQAVLAAVYRAGGWVGLAAFRALLVGVISGMVMLAVHLRAPGLRARTLALLAIGGFIVAAPAMALRPQLLGMALFALSLALLAARRRWPRVGWVVPLVAIGWVNVHGSFVLAPVLVAIFWIDGVTSRRRNPNSALVLLVATVAATLANPSMAGVWAYARDVATNREVRAQIAEWQPPSVTDIAGLLFWSSTLLVLGSSIVLVHRYRRNGQPLRALLPIGLTLAMFGLMGVIAARGVAWWPGAATVALAGLWADLGTGHETAGPQRRMAARGNPMNAIVAALVVVAGVAALPWWRPVTATLGAPAGLLTYAPAGITGALRELAGPTDRVWNPQEWGSWLEFAVPAPAYALDSRIEVIPAGAWADARVIAERASGWSDILDRRGVTVVITEAGASPLNDGLAGAGNWAIVFSDADGTIWRRLASR